MGYNLVVLMPWPKENDYVLYQITVEFFLAQFDVLSEYCKYNILYGNIFPYLGGMITDSLVII